MLLLGVPLCFDSLFPYLLVVACDFGGMLMLLNDQQFAVQALVSSLFVANEASSYVAQVVEIFVQHFPITHGSIQTLDLQYKSVFEIPLHNILAYSDSTLPPYSPCVPAGSVGASYPTCVGTFERPIWMVWLVHISPD